MKKIKIERLQRMANSVARKSRYGRATEVIFGNVNEPKIIDACSYYYTTWSGDYIYHPSAYRRTGFSNMHYHSAYCIVMFPLSIVDWN